MSTFGEIKGSKKRVTTYGKAARKHVANYHGGSRNIFDEPQHVDTAPGTSGEIQNSLNVSSVSYGNGSTRSPSITSAHSDMFDIPSDRDEGTGSAKKKRKIAHPATRIMKAVTENYIPETMTHVLPKHSAHAPKDTTQQQIERKQPSLSVNAQRRQYDISPPGCGVESQTTDLPSRHISFNNTDTFAAKILQNGLVNRDTPPQPLSTQKVTIERNIISTGSRISQGVLESRSAHEISFKTKPDRNKLPPSTPTTPHASNKVNNGSSTNVSKPIITPKGIKMWNGLLGDDDDDDNGPTVPISKTTPLRSTPDKQVASISPHGHLPRKRLIDTLVEQSRDYQRAMSPSSSSVGEDEEENHTGVSSTHARETLYQPTSLESQDVLKTLSQNEGDNKKSGSITFSLPNSQSLGPKITYSRQRSMLAEQDLLQNLEFLDQPSSTQMTDKQRNRRGSIPVLAPSPYLNETEESEDTQFGGAIRTVHELRQAGANKRFLDEMEDFLDRIGVPAKDTSMRRSGCLDLFEKLQSKEFYRNFISNGMDQRLFVNLGNETDIISGYLLLCLLMIVLEGGITPVAVAQLRRNGITRLLIRLINVRERISSIAKDRKNNLSKSAQMMITEQEKKMIELNLFDGANPTKLSPRSIALKCLEIVVRQSRESGNAEDIISDELTETLFGVIQEHSVDATWEQLIGPSAIDFQLALSTMESHSLKVMTSSNANWVAEYLPLTRHVLEISLKTSIDYLDVHQIILLRLVLNVTNNSSNASDVFAAPDFMGALGNAIIRNFKYLSGFLVENERISTVDHLVLMLGIMINFAEWSVKARNCLQDLEDSSQDPLNGLTEAFVVNLENVHEADSVEDSHRNVAFGYLAVLLGYLSLAPSLEERIRMKLPRKSLWSLIASIEEFISHHKKVDDLFEDDAEGHNPHAGFTERLQRMVEKLRESRQEGHIR